MTRIRPLLAALTAVLGTLFLPAFAQADSIAGYPIQVQASGGGKLGVYYDQQNGGSSSFFYSPTQSFGNAPDADAGLNLAVYSTDGGGNITGASVYGYAGTLQFTPCSGPTVLSDGNFPATYTLTSYYRAGAPCSGATSGLEVQEVAQYTDGDDFMEVRYYVKNLSASDPVRFRATAAADVEPGADPGGVGIPASGSPQIFGTLNQNHGAFVESQEVLAADWTAYQEATPDVIYRHIADDATNATGLVSGVSSSYGDKAQAVQWDRNRSQGGALAAGATSEFDLFWKFGDYVALSMDDSYVYKPTYSSSVTVDATATDYSGNPTDVTADPVLYRVDGPTNYPNDGSFATAPETAPNTGVVSMQWGPSTTAGSDVLTTFVDVNNNNIQDPNEASDTKTVYWFDRLSLLPDYYSYYSNPYIGGSGAVDVSIKDVNGDEQSGVAFTWERHGVNGDAGPTPGTSDFEFSPPEISYVGTHPGIDTITVKADFDADGTKGDDPGETRTFDLHWQNTISVSPGADASPVGTPVTVDTYAVDENGNELNGESLHYYVTGANATGDQTTGPLDFGYVSFQVSGSQTGTSTVHVYRDLNVNNGHDSDEPEATETIDWFAVARLTTNPSYVAAAMVGNQQSVTATLKDDTGASQDGNLRWKITGGVNPTVGETQVATSGGSSGPIMWTGSNLAGGTDYFQIYDDVNGNQQQDGDEPSAASFVHWVRKIDLSNAPNVLYISSPASPAQFSLNPTVRNQAGSTQSGVPVTWTVTRPGAPDINGSGMTDSFGNVQPAIQWSRTIGGTDTLTVHANNIDGAPYDSTATVDFTSPLHGYASDTTPNTGTDASVTPELSGGNASTVFHWSVDDGDSGTTDPSGTVTSDQYGIGTSDIEWSRTHVSTDVLDIWVDSDGVAGHTAGDKEITIVVHWQQAPLTLDVGGRADATGGGNITIHALAADSNGDPQSNQLIRWWVTEQYGDGRIGKHADFTDPQGSVAMTFSDQGVATGDRHDVLNAYEDLNADGIRQSNEPQVSTSVYWHPQIDPTTPDNYIYETATQTVTVTMRDLSYQPMPGVPLKYKITGANPHAVDTKTTDSNGQFTISWVGNEPGTDTLVVWQDNGATPNVPDPGELQTTRTYGWAHRLSVYMNGAEYGIDTGTQAAADVNAYTMTGNDLASTQLKYTIAGANPTSSPGTVTTNPYGNATIHWTGASSGRDDLKVWLDSNGNGVRDTGEPQTTGYAVWRNKLTLSFVNPNPSFATTTQTINAQVDMTGLTAPVTIHYSSSGPNSPGSGTLAYSSGTPQLLQWTGNRPGTDVVYAWADVDKDGVQTVNDPTAQLAMTWTPLISLSTSPASGTATAGATINVTATLVNTSNAPVAGATLKYRVTGANPVSTVTLGSTTDANGQVTFPVSGLSTGTDSIEVFRDSVTNNGSVDPGEPVNTTYVYWSAPPLTFNLDQTQTSKFAGNSVTITATLGGMPGGDTGRTIRYSVAGANPQSGTATDAGGGNYAVNWTGTDQGTDTVTIYADVSGASGSQDDYDPVATATVTWLPLVQFSSPTSQDAIGGTHTETIRLLDSNGNPVSNAEVSYTITGANATNGVLLARPVSAGGAPLYASTDGNGYVSVSWVGANSGVDTLTVWQDANHNGIADANEPHASKTVTWVASAASAPPSSSPTASPAAVTPGSANDFDGLLSPPPPVVAKAVNVAPVSGKVLVKLPGKNNFIELLDAEQIPVGSIVDVTKGRVALTAAQNAKGGVATAQFYLGTFQIGQKKAAKPITDLTLVGGNFKPCSKILKGAAHNSQKKQVRQLWGSGKGLFRTKGKYAAASIRGTTWDVVDFCDGTLVKVTQGIITVTDNVKHKDLILKAPKKYFAAAKKK